MSAIREVTVFSLGDSRRVRTWSNVPYFFTSTLLDKGIRVNRVDLSPAPWGALLNRTVFRLLRLWLPGSSYDYFRSSLHYGDMKRRIQDALVRHPKADANIFLTFSFSSAGMSRQPTVLFGDWTYEHHCRHFLGREPDALERTSVERENREIEAADCVFALFPSVAEHMKRHYANRNIHYLGNVVNASLEVSEADVLERKRRSKTLLFIGGRKYVEGARRLLAAYDRLKPHHPELTVSIVGLTDKDLGPLSPGVQCHGYLDKGSDSDRELYYRLLLDARCIVNTTPKWGAFSAMIEAMYFYTPVVVTPYDEFVETFGRTIGFGFYDVSDTVAELEGHLETLLDDGCYLERCRAAHDAVKGYTWSAYIDRLLARIGHASPQHAGGGAIVRAST